MDKKRDDIRREPTETAQTIGRDVERIDAWTPQPDEAQSRSPRDVRGAQTTQADQSLHRRFHWFYEDLLA